MNVCEKKEAIAAALNQCVPHPRLQKRGNWEFTLVNGKPFRVNARIENDWLVFETDAVDLKDSDWWSLLRLNHQLGVCTKFVLLPRDSKPTLRTELLLSEEIDLAGRLASMRDQLVSAMGLIHRAAAKPIENERSESSDQTSIKELCANSGWPGTERPDSTIAVELEVEHTFQQAIVGRDEASRLKVVCELQPLLRSSTGEHSSLLKTEAISHLLLHVSSLLRMVRAEAVRNPDQLQQGSEEIFNVRLKTLLGADVTAFELNEALVNSSVAWELTGRETQALRDADVANAYLQTVMREIEFSRDLEDHQERRGD
jgi:hypothetical protein